MAVKNYSNKLSILILFFIVIILSGCFSHWQGDSAKVVISFGRADRGIYYNPDDIVVHQRLEHKITFTGEAKTLEFTFNGSGVFEAYLEPGDWNVEIVSWLNGDVYAKGEKDVSLKLGLNNEIINMNRAHLVKFVPGGGSAIIEQVIYHTMKIEDPPNAPVGDGWYDDSFTERINLEEIRIFESVTFYGRWNDPKFPENETLQRKLEWINLYAIDGGYYDITVGDDDKELPPTAISCKGKSVTIVLTNGDNQTKEINLSGTGSLFTVGDGVILKLDSYITLKGHKDNNKPLISVSGKLIMNPFSKITENNNNNNNDGDVCGGVFIKGGNFIMNGGEISCNNANQGGGVWVEGGGTFTMNGGEITNNTTNVQWGGCGVKIYKGTFIMNGGEISFNYSRDGINDHGGGVNVHEGSIFIMNGGKISDNDITSEIPDEEEIQYGGIGGGVFLYRAIFMMNGGEISGNKARSAGGVWVGDNSTFTMKNGKIYDNTADKWGAGGIYVDKSSTFYMYGGDINKNNGWSGGGIFAAGTFEMEGGNISGNTAEYGGGGVEAGDDVGIFYLRGGNISGNNAIGSGGGGVYMNGKTFIMSGGKIYGNTAKGGGGVLVTSNKTFTMTDGEITKNTATEWNGGGVRLFYNGIFNKTGGTITGCNDPVNGNMAILGIKNNDCGHAVFADKGKEDYSALHRRETTAGPNTPLDSSKSGKSGGWED